MKTLFLDVRRPSKNPAAGLPFGVRSAGHDRFRALHHANRKIIQHVQIFWCVQGKATVEIQGRPRTVGRHQIAIYFPGMEHYFRVDQSVWDCFWLTLDGPFAAQIVSAYGLEPNVYTVGPPPVQTFETLMKLVTCPGKPCELEAGVHAYALLAQMALHHHQSDTLVEATVEIMHRRWNDSDLNLKTLANLLHAEPTTLSTRFSRIMGFAPSAYLERLRISHALSLLRYTHQPIHVIAHKCGYRDANYFSRVIRKITSHPPKEFRGRIKDQPS